MVTEPKITDSDPTGTYDLPGFAQPESPWTPPSRRNPAAYLSPSSAEPGGDSPSSHGSLSDPSAPSSPRPGPDGDTRTGTSSPASGREKKAGGDPAAAGKMVAGLLGMVAAIAAGFLRRRRRELRMPTKQQLRDVGDPLGRILVRHADLTLLGDDLNDFIQGGAATGAYLTEDALTTPLAADSGVPDGINEGV